MAHWSSLRNMKPTVGQMYSLNGLWRQHPLSRGLVGWWLFNEGGGNRAFDYSGNGNHGTLTNMNLASCWLGSPRGQALEFQGSSDLISIPDVNLFSFGNGVADVPFSTSAWIYWSGTLPIGGGHIISKWNTAGNREWRVLIQTTGDLEFILSDASGNAERRHSSLLSQGRWYHIVTTYNGNSSYTGMNVYIDGRLNNDDFTDTPYTAMTNGNANIGIGNIAQASSLWGFPGLIDDVRVYNRALSPVEIEQLYYDCYANVRWASELVTRTYFVPAVAAVGPPVGGLALIGAGR